jgi:hypothetical protein
LLGLALVGVTVVVFDAVAGAIAATVAGLVALIAFLTFWLVLPLLMRSGGQQPRTP